MTEKLMQEMIFHFARLTEIAECQQERFASVTEDIQRLREVADKLQELAKAL